MECIIHGTAGTAKDFQLGLMGFPNYYKNGLLKAAGLVNSSKDIVPVSFISISDKPKEVRKDEELTTCVPVTFRS